MLLSQKTHSLAITSLDARVLLTESQSKHELLPALNLVNNFPVHWNRNEVNDGSLSFRMQLKPFRKGAKVADIERFTDMASSPLFVRDSWLSAEDPQQSAFQLSGSGLSIESLKRSRDGKALMLQVKNSGASGTAMGLLASPYFNERTSGYASNLLETKQSKMVMKEGLMQISLTPSQLLSIRIENLNRIVRDESK